MEAGAEVREVEGDEEATVVQAAEWDRATGSVHLTNRMRIASHPLQTLFLWARAPLEIIREDQGQAIECLVSKEPVVRKQGQKTCVLPLMLLMLRLREACRQ